MSTEQRIITDPKEVQAKMMALHRELGNFAVYIARQSVPPKWEGDEQMMIEGVLLILEREVKRIGITVRKQTIDDLVENSLKQAGFKPDEPPATDSK